MRAYLPLAAALLVAAMSTAPPDMAATVPGADAGSVSVTLVTGDRIVGSAGGGPVATIPSEGDGGPMLSFTDPTGDRYVVPSVAAPYAGRQLDLSLFDVSALARARTRDGIPVELSFATGATPVAPPGVTLTAASGGVARGYVNVASTSRFAAMLRERIGADIAAGREPGTGPLPGGLVRMALAAPTTPGPATPAYPMRVVQLTTVGLSGQLANSFVTLFNVDSARRLPGKALFTHGEIQRLAVPEGHYVALSFFYDFDQHGRLVAGRWVTPGFTVSDSGAVTTIGIDERSASSRISVATPQQAAEDGMTVTFIPQDAAGQTGLVVTAGGAASHGADFYVTPTSAAAVGNLRFLVSWGGQSATARYDVAFGSNNVPAVNAYTVDPNELAVVRQRFFADPTDTPRAAFLKAPLDPVTGRIGGLVYGNPGGVPAPGEVTEYVGTADGGQWLQMTQMPGNVLYSADDRTFTAGHHYSIDWGHGPQTAEFGQHSGPHQWWNSIQYPHCLACSDGGTLSLFFADDAADSDPTHQGTVLDATTRITLYRDGTQVVDGQNAVGTVVTSAPGAYRAVFDVDRGTQPTGSHSSHTHTELTFRDLPGSALPAGNTCFGESAATACHILPVLTLNYQLATDQTGTSTAPRQLMRLDVAHLSYDGAGSHDPITSVTVAVSFDGTTWQPATVHRDNGQYLVAWPNPTSAQGTSPALRVTAADAAGGSITQTVTNAYTIAAASH
ncbi:hypothetical protein [Kutzneria buriramensis]|uniref:Uncharacterized protein n=1 Tax=Kutzneria buriramensis TaxID=1045776 RepID=A0A3E0HIS4_9PSEU|nr:hypothetical protein [Kutzneria buriramensis]REH46096.1 hypothetical protein BCF44_107229 [Kutzneria buriramensis]